MPTMHYQAPVKLILKSTLIRLAALLIICFNLVSRVINWLLIVLLVCEYTCIINGRVCNPKNQLHKSIPLPPWVVHWSIQLINSSWNWRHDCCLRRTMCFYYGRVAQFIFKISCSTQKTEWNLLLSQTLSRVVVG